MQVSTYAQRFNLSTSLAASITRVSAQLASLILLALLAAMGRHLHLLRDMASLPAFIAAVRRPVLAAAFAAAGLLVACVPVSARLAQKSRSQGPRGSQAATASSPPGSSNPFAEEGRNDVQRSASGGRVPGSGSSSARSGVGGAGAATDAGSEAASSAVQGPEREPSEDPISDPATLPASPSSTAGDADAGGLKDSSVDIGTPGLALDSNVHKALDAQEGGGSDRQDPTVSSEQGPATADSQARPDGTGPSSGFFRDIGTACLLNSRHKHLQPKLPLKMLFGTVERARPRKPLLVRVQTRQVLACCKGATSTLV